MSLIMHYDFFCSNDPSPIVWFQGFLSKKRLAMWGLLSSDIVLHICGVRFLFFTSFTVYQHWRSTAICAVALGLPNLNYVHGTELTSVVYRNYTCTACCFTRLCFWSELCLWKNNNIMNMNMNKMANFSFG